MDFRATSALSAANHGAGGPAATKHRALDGSFQMQPGGRDPYSNLRMAGHVDWIHVNPALLKAVNAVAASHGLVVDVHEGYHANAHARQAGGAPGDAHTKGHAIHAYVSGHPIGHVIHPDTFHHYGVRVGASPEHIQL